jgi:dTDP-4-amino-4,6-dideoxygalactose transaminase
MIDFNKVAILGNELEYIQKAYENNHLSGDGEFTKKCHTYLEKNLGVHKALLTTSCTHALEMAALLLKLKPGDEIIAPSFTFVSTINAFLLHGAKPVIVDVRPDTLNLDENLVESYITERTKAIVPVHYAGVACEMEKLQVIANKHNLHIVEDNAHGLFSKYKGKYTGTFGTFATQSFHETKNFSCGEGGALLINNPNFVERAEIIREKGTNRSRFFRGMIDKYTWVDLGSSYIPSDILAAVLYAQFEKRDLIQKRRKIIWDQYNQHLASWAAENNFRLPIIPEECEQSYHMFYMLAPDLETRTRFIQTLREQDIYSVFHYLPLHLSDMGKDLGGKPGDCPVTEQVSDQLVRLPLNNSMGLDDVERVIDAILEFKS